MIEIRVLKLNQKRPKQDILSNFRLLYFKIEGTKNLLSNDTKLLNTRFFLISVSFRIFESCCCNMQLKFVSIDMSILVRRKTTCRWCDRHKLIVIIFNEDLCLCDSCSLSTYRLCFIGYGALNEAHLCHFSFSCKAVLHNGLLYTDWSTENVLMHRVRLMLEPSMHFLLQLLAQK